MGQTNAWVNIDAGGLAKVDGRYANYSIAVPGLAAKVGLFDNCISIKGRAKADGTVTMAVEGKQLSVKVARGDTAAQVLEKLKAQLPKEVSGVTLAGDVQPYDGASYKGTAAKSTDAAAHLMLFKPKSLGLKAGEVPMKVVVTGYGAFMGITDNPSSNMAQKLAQAGVPGAVVEHRRLDVTPEAVDAFITEMRKSPPDVILSMGVTGGQSQVEERPENHLGAAEDGNGQMMTDRQVRANGPAELKTDLPVETIDWALKGFGDQRQVFTSKSDPNYAPDRSAYLCNYLGFNLATEFGATDATTAGFMHITDTTPVDQMHAVLQAITARQLDMRRGQTPKS
jgi:pyrrolidone-carboxylate peptidase